MGASAPRSTMIPRITAEIRDARLRSTRRTASANGDSRGRTTLVRAESWISPGIKRVGEKTAQCHHDAADDHCSHNQRVVAGADAVHERVTHSRPAKNPLDEYGTGKKRG